MRTKISRICDTGLTLIVCSANRLRIWRSGEKCAADVPPWISEELDLLACQYTACAVCMMSLVRAQQWEPKNSKPIGLDFFICVRRTQHHLTEGQHHFEQSENIISHSSGHKTMLQRVANDVMLRINDVGYAQFLSN